MIYLDSCIVIYAVEPHAVWTDLTAVALRQVAAGAQLAVSPLVKMECLVGPLRQQNEGLLLRYSVYFDELATLEMPEQVYLEAARIRAQLGLKLPDALHLACARHHGCASLWTNDTRLSAAGGDLVRVLAPE